MDGVPLEVELVNVRPVARRICAQDPAYPWGDGVPPGLWMRENGGTNVCHPVSPGRAPSKWPTPLDYRNVGFQPWSQGTATASPAGYEGLFVILSGTSPWPDHSDNLKVVRLYPEQDPSLPTLSSRWRTVGLSGGELFVDKKYVKFEDSTETEPAGALLIRSGAVTDVGGSEEEWQGERFVFETFLQYQGDFRFFGPVPIRNLRRVNSVSGGCSNCNDVEFTLSLPEMGIDSELQGGEIVSQINGAIASHRPDVATPGTCQWLWFIDEVVKLVDFDGCADQTNLFVRSTFRLEWSPANQVILAQANYSANLHQGAEGCPANNGFLCCEAVDNAYGLGENPTDGAGIYAVNYAGAMPSPLDCDQLKSFLNSTQLGAIQEFGSPWAGRFPSVLSLSTSD